MNRAGLELPGLPPYLSNLPPAERGSQDFGQVGAASTPVDPIGIETYNVTVDPLPFGSNLVPVELLVYTTHRRWKAIDVFATPTVPTTFTGSLNFYIYGINEGRRALLTSGRMDLTANSIATGPLQISVPTWVAGMRSVAQTYQVVFSLTAPGPVGQQVGSVQITIAASDRADPVPDWVGTLRVAGTQINGFALNTPRPTQTEIVGLAWTNLAAAARWLHIYETVAVIGTNPAFFAGMTPNVAIFGAGSAIGAAFADRLFRYRTRGQFLMFGSSTGSTSTAATDVHIEAVLR